MSDPFFPVSVRETLNKMNPAAARVGLGDIVADLQEKAAEPDAPADIPPATTAEPGLMSAQDKSKLNGIAAQATRNETDANLRDRANHSGSQAATTVNVAADAASGVAAGNLQVAFVALANRVKTLEDAAGGG